MTILSQMSNAQKAEFGGAVRSLEMTAAVIDQSVGHGTVQLADTAYPQAFASLIDPAVRCPIAPSVNRNGGYLCGVHDELAAEGIRAAIVNAAVPSLSFQTQTAGFLKPLQRNAAYVGQRPSYGEGDYGDAGDYVLYSNRVFQCIAGTTRGAFFASMSVPNLSGGGALQTGIAQTGSAATAASQPAAWDTIAIGDTVVDGGCTFRRVDASLYASATNNSSVMTVDQMGRGYDPLSVIYRASREAARVNRSGPRVAIIMNGQSDLGAGPITYGRVLQSIGEGCLRQGFSDVMFGLTCWSPGSSGATTAAYDNLSAGVQNAITNLGALHPNRVWAGPNLYQLMGTTGPMAAGGAFLQADNIHLNGAGSVGPAVGGVSSAKVHVANAIKAMLRAKGLIA